MSPHQPRAAAYLLHGCVRLCCGCWQAKEWKNKRWRRGSAARARPCKHGVPLPSPALEGCPVTVPARALELGMMQAANEALEAQEIVRQRQFSSMGFDKRVAWTPPCLHRATLRDQPLSSGSTGGDRCSPVPGASPFLQ